MANKKCLIFTSCPDFDGKIMKNRLPRDAFVICADGGYLNAVKAGFKCDFLVGDRDSIGETDVDCEEYRVSSIKDDTDLMLSIKLAMERGFDEFYIADSLTGRFEQVVANVQSLFYIANRGFKASIISGNSEISFLQGGEEMTVNVDECRYFSLFAYGGTADGISIENAKYPLKNASLTCDFPLGVSNEPLDVPVTVKIEKGSVLLIKTI